jgi:tripartite-type tricarboxylate transporter receptor subunit TctC
MKILLSLLLFIASPVMAIEFTVHHAPGGPSDRATRIIAAHLPAHYYVVNRPGAMGQIAVKSLVSKPSIMLATMPQIYAANQLLSNSTYSAERDLELVAVVAVMPQLVVCRADLKIANVAQLINYNRRLTWAVAAWGSSEHLATAVLLSKWPNQHEIIPYAQGGNKHVADLLGGHVDCIFANWPLAQPLLDNPAVRAIVSTHAVAGHDFALWSNTWGRWPVTAHLGIVVDRALAPQIKAAISQDLQQAIAKPQLAQQLMSVGLIPAVSMDAKELASVVAQQTALAQLMLRLGIAPR